MAFEVIGQPIARVDGRLKVTGAAQYAADFNRPGQAHGVIVAANVGLGRITTLETASARDMPGVLAVISHLNAPRLAYLPHKDSSIPKAASACMYFRTMRCASTASPLPWSWPRRSIRPSAPRPPLPLPMMRTRRWSISPRPKPRRSCRRPRTSRARASGRTRRGGDADVALGSADVSLDRHYDIAREHHNPMEPHATLAEWQGDRLTLWSKSQWVTSEQGEIAAIFGIPPGHVQVICPFIGGAFGTSLRSWPHVTIAALAARMVGRPVKLVLTRRQMFFATGHRPRSAQRVALGAERSGRLTALIHEGWGETSRYEQFIEALTSASNFMYSCPNVRTRYRIVPLDIGTSTYMRGPGEASGIHALECAMDELAYELNIDPVELRRVSEPQIDEGAGRPFSSRSLLQCLTLGAERFGWHERNPQPRSMRDGRLLVGMGMASTTYPSGQMQSEALARLRPDGIVEIEAGTSDMGPGTYTSMTQVAAGTLGVPMEQIRFSLGRSDLPPTAPQGGSLTMASVGSAVRDACLALRARAAAQAMADPWSPLFGASPDDLEWRAARLPMSQASGGGQTLADIGRRAARPIEARASSKRSPEEAARYSMHAFGAVFVEVTVDPDIGVIHIRRALGAYAAGRIVNPRLAHSQCVGGMVGGIGMALMERTVLDPRDGRPVNAHMADYLVPVNLDIGRIDALFVDEGRPARQSARRQGHRRDRAGGDGPGHRQCRVPRHRQAHPQPADPHRGCPGAISENAPEDGNPSASTARPAKSARAVQASLPARQ